MGSIRFQYPPNGLFRQKHVRELESSYYKGILCIIIPFGLRSGASAIDHASDASVPVKMWYNTIKNILISLYFKYFYKQSISAYVYRCVRSRSSPSGGNQIVGGGGTSSLMNPSSSDVLLNELQN